MFNPTLIVIEAFIRELRTMYENELTNPGRVTPLLVLQPRLPWKISQRAMQHTTM